MRRLIDFSQPVAILLLAILHSIPDFGDLTLVEPGLTDVWAWRPEADVFPMTTDFMRIIGAVARKG